MDTVDAARASVNIWYNDKNISADIAPMLESFEYSSFASGKVDEISITLKDPDDRWCGKWKPTKFARIKAEIIYGEVSAPSPQPSLRRIERSRLSCGTFAVDSPSYGNDRITIKALAASASTSIRREKRTRLWQGVTLKQLAAKIAADQGTTIAFYGSDTQPFGKIEQKDMADLPFLLDQCERWGYCLKIKSNQIVIFEQGDIDAQSPVMTILRRGGTLVQGSDNFSEEHVDRYRGCKVKYKHPDVGLLMAIYTPENGSSEGPLLTVREHASNQAEALKIAKARFELANRESISAELTVLGDAHLVAGVTVMCSGWGQYDGKYSVDEAIHKIDGGYQTKLKCAKVVQ